MAVTFLHKLDKEAVVKKMDVLENNGIKVRRAKKANIKKLRVSATLTEIHVSDN